MSIYILLFLLLLTLTLSILKKNLLCGNFSLKQKSYGCIIVFAIFAITVAFRDITVGTDTILYSRIYNIINSNEFDFNLSSTPAFIYYCANYVLGYFFTDSISIRIFQSLVTYLCIYKIIIKSSEYKYFSLLLFLAFCYFAHSMNIFRQMMAIFLAIYSVQLAFIDKRLYSAVILGLCAVLIHITSAIVFSIPLLYFVIKTLRSNCCIFLVCVVLAFIFNFIFYYVVYFVVDNIVHYRVYVNTKSPLDIFASNTSGTVAYLFLFYLAILVIYVLKKPFKSNNCKKFMQLVLPFVVVCTVFNLLNPFNEIIFRLFLPSNILLCLIVIPNVYSVLSIKEKAIYLPMILVAAVFYYYYILFVINCGEVVPYSLTSLFEL